MSGVSRSAHKWFPSREHIGQSYRGRRRTFDGRNDALHVSRSERGFKHSKASRPVVGEPVPQSGGGHQSDIGKIVSASQCCGAWHKLDAPGFSGHVSESVCSRGRFSQGSVSRIEISRSSACSSMSASAGPALARGAALAAPSAARPLPAAEARTASCNGPNRGGDLDLAGR